MLLKCRRFVRAIGSTVFTMNLPQVRQGGADLNAVKIISIARRYLAAIGTRSSRRSEMRQVRWKVKYEDRPL